MTNEQHAFEKVKTKKKGPSPKYEKFLSPTSREDQKKGPRIIHRSNADYSQIIEGIQSNYWGYNIPPSPRVSAPLTAAPGYPLHGSH